MKKLKYILSHLLSAALLYCCLGMTTADRHPFFSTGIAIDGEKNIYLSQKGVRRIDVFAPDGVTLLKSYPMDEAPTGILLGDKKAYVTTFGSVGHLQILDLESGKVEASVPAGSGTCYPMYSPDGKYIYVCNQFSNTVSEIDPETRKVLRTVNVLREPRSAVFSKDGKYLFVTNFLPAQRADVDYVASCVSVIDMATFGKMEDIPLANGSNALGGICITPDGKYLYVSHNLGRYTVPTSQLQQGWMNTSGFSVIDVATQTFMGVVLVDEPERGAAGVWDITCNADYIFVSHSGTHEVSVIDHPAMREKFENYPNKNMLDYDLNFLYGLRERIRLKGNGPRNMLLHGMQLFIPTYFADVLNIIDIESRELQSVEMNPGRKESIIHKGERIFNDADKCFQNWQSCNGCHPGDARMDAMNWDLMNDGVGNSKNCKSMLFSHVTPPNMISGIRAKAEIAVDAGFKFIQFFNLDDESLSWVDEYLKSLEPVSSPFLVNGELSEKAKEGRKVFDKLKCGDCHSGPYFTNMNIYRIGEDIEFEKGWDTPTLREVWRTSPYLFDGRAATMMDVFEEHKHGIEKKVSKKDLEALAEYVNSL
ncbi:MAG: YVTN family beta-propeller repeat-containing protein [Tannerellaceae bacterium]|nr:YVTN family beta-propeller repeat-containing protein [Tannerellaceae bacterium]